MFVKSIQIVTMPTHSQHSNPEPTVWHEASIKRHQHEAVNLINAMQFVIITRREAGSSLWHWRRLRVYYFPIHNTEILRSSIKRSQLITNKAGEKSIKNNRNEMLETVRLSPLHSVAWPELQVNMPWRYAAKSLMDWCFDVFLYVSPFMLLSVRWKREKKLLKNKETTRYEQNR